MNFKKLIVTAIAPIALVSVANAAPDLISTVTATKSGTNIEIDFVNNGEVSGMQFDLVMPKDVAKGADLKNCLSGLNSAFSMSTCTLTKSGVIRVVVLSPNGAILPTGAIGTVTLPGGVTGAKAGGDIRLDGVVMGTANGTAVAADFVE